MSRKPVILDARKKAVIKIKPLDGKRGKAGEPGGCAAARACMRDLHASAARINVSRTYVQVPVKIAIRQFGVKQTTRTPRSGKVWVRFRTPMAIRTEVVTYDRARSFQPGEYTLPALQPSHRARGKRHGSKHFVRRGNARPRPRHTLVGVRQFNTDELALI